MLDLLFPRRCPVCDDIVTPYGEKICLPCMEKLRLVEPPWCMQCGRKLFEEAEFCAECKKGQHAFDRGRALYAYESVAGSIYRLKYGGRAEYADFFGREMGVLLKDFLNSTKPQAILPVPLHKKRLRKRGYNQAALLARALSQETQIPVCENLVHRTKNTIPLKVLTASQRQNNLKNAFHIAQNDVKLETILIVDDIYTTGSTVDHLAALLKEHGVKKVFFLTIATGAGL